MFVNIDGIEIMVRARREELIQRSSLAPLPKRRSGHPVIRRTMIRLGGLFILLGMALERIGLGREVYQLSTTASHECEVYNNA